MKKTIWIALLCASPAGAFAEECVSNNEIPAFRQLLTEANDRIVGTAGKLLSSDAKIKTLTEELDAAKKELEILKKKTEAK